MNRNEVIRAVLIDDEPEALEVLSVLLRQHPKVEIAGTAGDAGSGYMRIAELKPDLVFLDIRMPRESGFDLVKRMKTLPVLPAVVFVTAYDEYAIHAFKVAAFDYLLKPVDPDALADTLNRFSATRSTADFSDKVDHLIRHLHHDDRLRVNTRTGYLLINPDEILYALAEGNYTVIFFTPSRSETVTLSIGRLLELLPAGHFLRISRSAIVNRTWLYRVDRRKRTCELRKNGESVGLEVSKESLKELGDPTPAFGRPSPNREGPGVGPFIQKSTPFIQ